MTDTVTNLPAFPFTNALGTVFTPVADADRQRLAGPVSQVILPTGTVAWLVTRHADVRQVLRHPGFTSDITRPGFPLPRTLPPLTERERAGSFIRMDGEEHARFRRMLTGEFMIKNIRRIEPMIQRTVIEALDAMEAGGSPVDLVSTFALPVPSMVICHLLGVPYEDHVFFQRQSRIMLDRNRPFEEIRGAAEELREYVGALIERKRVEETPGEDLLSRLVVERLEPGEINRDELVGIALLLLVAGHETTANMLGLSVLLLLQRPEWMESLRTDPDVGPGMVEELLRYLTIIRTGLPRLATEDVEVGGQLVRAGEGVIAMLAMANRDEGVFVEPDEFDPHREAHQQIAFGFGVHQCVGQPLARAELRIALVELARRFPGLRATTTPDDAPVRTSSLIFGLAELPVTW